ncbi:hypothetical protein BX600DRAFT_518712 [Xylariales sp. PMI_506]|nr:hypothetical protein BX600DRAFT_518712 [Xylariales sp. PMI_506]
MGPSVGQLRLLPRDLAELQLAQVDLLMAMYPSDGAVILDETSAASLDTLRDWCGSEAANDDAEAAPSGISSNISLSLTLEVDEEEHQQDSALEQRSIGLDITIPFSYDETGPEPPSEPPHPKLRLRQPAWLSKAEAATLAASVSQDEEDLFAAIDLVRGAAVLHLAAAREAAAAETEKTQGNGNTGAGSPLVRVWFYFPSISTRAKRDDIVHHAPRYGLTGFLLAGKPGVLCLEGASHSVDEYMKFIKTESWGDIPAHQKKVSERHRETGPGVRRTFADMQEITDALGERRGERANRSDMKALEAWLMDRGLGDSFMKVLI